MSAVQDAAVRAQALNVAESFIVQAPAGSGKTELLTQRFLALLAVADKPEAILAMTFTKKAASEMRSRIMAQLRHAEEHPQADANWKPHELATWQLARNALAHDADCGWQLLKHPARLRIQTIDSFCSSLVLQMPYLSRLGGMSRTSEDASVLYHEAARATLQALDDDEGGISEALFTVLGYLDNQRSQLQAVISQMLGRREQWLRHIRPGEDAAAFKADMESSLEQLAEQSLQQLFGHHGTFWLHALRPAWQFACEYFREQGIDHPITRIERWPDWDNAGIELLDDLRTISAWVLTDNGTGNWRKPKGVNVKIGFPTEKDYPDRNAVEAKAQFTEWLEARAQEPGLLEDLRQLAWLPGFEIPDAEWAFFDALRTILVYAVGQLRLVSAEQGELDFNEVTLSALCALGDENEPTDLAIRKDQQIHHILVDEFQDTSHPQFELLKRLTREWQPDDGRTVFLVGDPMQSIYRFREGDVGLFLRVREQGFGSADDHAVHPVALELSANFRSVPAIIDWVNEHFACVFPAEEDMARGAIRYAHSTATREPDNAPAVQWHPFINDDGSAEAERIAHIIRERIPHLGEEESIAILVRARSHLGSIVAALHRNHLPFQAVDIEPLGAKQSTEDLLALTRAVLHPADREAWLAVLRAPWCALTLVELETLMKGMPSHLTVWECLSDTARWQAFESRARIERLISVMQRAMAARSRQGLRARIEAAWIALGGPATLVEASGYDDAEAFFRLVEELEKSADDIAAELPEALDSLYASPDASSEAARIKLMTVHGSKGLQFDTVILPELHKKGRSDDKRLLHWQQITLNEGDALLMAPLDSTEENSGLYRFLHEFEKAKAHYELQRLLYVAATRAKNRLHLLANVKPSSKGELKAPAGSMLELLWPMAGPLFAALDIPEEPEAFDMSGFVPRIARLKPEWSLPDVIAEPAIVQPEHDVLTPYRGESPDHWLSIGTVVHEYLELIHRTGVAQWHEERVLALESAIQARLAALGVAHKEQLNAVQKVMEGLCTTLNDPTGRWLLDNTHDDSRAELELYLIEPQATTTHIVDRSFIESGTRYIVDYKTAVLAKGQSADAFLAEQQEQYREQLERYAQLFAKVEEHPIQLMLYFPLLGMEIRWTYESGSSHPENNNE